MSFIEELFGFGLEENRVAIETVASIRGGSPQGGGEKHMCIARVRK